MHCLIVCVCQEVCVCVCIGVYAWPNSRLAQVLELDQLHLLTLFTQHRNRDDPPHPDESYLQRQLLSCSSSRLRISLSV